MIDSVGTTSRHTFEEPNIQSWLVNIWLSLLICFLAVELLDLNHLLRTWIQGEAFWVYIISVLTVLGMVSSGLMLVAPQIKRFVTWKILALGVGVGFVSGLVAILLNAPLLGKGFAPSWHALRDPGQLIIASALGMGWLYGGIAALACHFLVRRAYRQIGYLLLACLGVRVLELILNFFVARKT